MRQCTTKVKHMKVTIIELSLLQAGETEKTEWNTNP